MRQLCQQLHKMPPQSKLPCNVPDIFMTVDIVLIHPNNGVDVEFNSNIDKVESVDKLFKFDEVELPDKELSS
jgi:hypothetical protein